MIQLTDNLEINKPAPVDDRLGVFESTAEALAYIAEDRRYVGLTFIVDSGSGATEYWFENGVQDGDLTAKSTGGGGATWGTITGTLSNQTDLNTALDGKVDKVAGKGLSTEDYTSAEKTKLAGIEAGAEVNVNADWNATSGDALILNKPTIPSITNLVPYTGANQDVDLGTNNLNAKSVKINGTAGNGHVGLKHQSANATAQGSETALFAGSDGELYYKNDGLTLAQIASRAWVNAQGFITNVITALGFTPENVANKQTDLTASATKYPTVNAVNTGLATKEPTITSGTSSQFFKGDKTWATITASDVPSLDTSKITTGTFASARIPKITRPNVFDSTAALAGNTTSETVIKTITIPANTLSVGDVVKLGVLYSFASNTNTKTARIRFGSNTTSGTQIFSSASMLSTVTGLSIELWLIVTSSTNMRVVSSANTTTLGSVSGNINNLTIDITTATSFSVTITKTTAGDTATCEMSYVEILTA